jgi:hypothetical protein
MEQSTSPSFPASGQPEFDGVWVTESSVERQIAFAIAAIVVGLALASGFRSFEGPGFSGERAGFLLGCLLLIVAVGALLTCGKQVISVDPNARQIVIEKHGRFGTAPKTIRFDEISEAYLGEFGDEEGGSTSYHVVLKLKTGREVHLFRGFYVGSHSKVAMEGRLQRLTRYLL